MFYVEMTKRNTINATVIELKVNLIPIFVINLNVVEDMKWDMNLTAYTKNMMKTAFLQQYKFEQTGQDKISKYNTTIQFKLSVITSTNATLFSKAWVLTDSRGIILQIYTNQTKVDDQIVTNLKIYYTITPPEPYDRIEKNLERNLNTTVVYQKW